MNKFFTLISFFILHCIFFIAEAMAQTPPPASAAAPLDGFTGLLIAGGIGLGYKALKDRNPDG